MSQTNMLPPQQSQLFDLPSGAKLAVTAASFADAWALTKAALKTIKGLDLGPEVADSASLLQMKSGKLTLPILKIALDRIVDFIASPEVEAAMWKCAQSALYIPLGSPVEFPGGKVSAYLSDPDHGMSIREDFARIQIAIVEVNCRPFLEKALSGFFKPKAEVGAASQKS